MDASRKLVKDGMEKMFYADFKPIDGKTLTDVANDMYEACKSISDDDR